MKRAVLALLAAISTMAVAVSSAQTHHATLVHAAGLVGVPSEALAPDLRTALAAMPDAIPPPTLLGDVLAQPLGAVDQARALRAAFAGDAGSPVASLRRLAGLYAQAPVPQPLAHAARLDAGEPLATAMAHIWQVAGDSPPAWSLPAETPEHRPLRIAVANMLLALADAEVLRRQALAALPATIAPAWLCDHLSGDRNDAQRETLLRHAVGAVDRRALAAGMLRLAAAVERMAQDLPAQVTGPGVDWQWSTPLGEVRIDTTGRNNRHVLHDPLLVVDLGGDDHYVLAGRAASNRMSVVLDGGGDDHYEVLASGDDAALGLLGYGVVWDRGEGNDRYSGGWLAQGSAVFGAALLVDEGGRDRYEATGLAQGYAMAGLALLADGGGDDTYRAGSMAQASAGPAGAALLLDRAGNDNYVLWAAPVVVRSPQLPDRNTSLGQGSGHGLRAAGAAPALAGGTGLLLDLAGDDHYSGQVFAQGVGYYFGVGMLVDRGGNDRFDAAWYAQGAAAHAGVGVLLDEGTGNDRYRASHSTALGAAHDHAVAHFRDDGGDDHYVLGNLGLGAAQDASVAVFVDASGDDHYESGGPPCHAFGVARYSPQGPSFSDDATGLGLFLDLGGRDRYPPACQQVRENSAWQGPDTRAGPALGLDTDGKDLGHE